jgi:hypothetical protein
MVFNPTHPYLGDQEHTLEVLPVRLQNVDDVLSLLNTFEQNLAIER